MTWINLLAEGVQDHHACQEAIAREMLDIVGGAEALARARG